MAWLIAASSFGQKQNHFFAKKIIITSDTTLIDSLGFAPEGLFILKGNNPISSDSVKVDYLQGKIIAPNFLGDTLIIRYRQLPQVFTQRYFHKDPLLITPQPDIIKNPFVFSPNTKKPELISLGGLNKSGSISRGITIGNNQDLVLNSSLNLQLSGKLNDEIEVLAAISDDNIPIQPEGNTQQIQEFDRVFIQLKNKKNILTAGDFELKRPNSYFMSFSKRLKGGYITSNFSPSTLSEMQVGVAAAVAKGKYTRYNFIGQEGNQGPYRLRGMNNEQFIIVLSGTERVYIDGELLKRGEGFDYVIDYNAATLTFTSRRLITQYTRIVVEFEYSDRNYARSLVYANNEYKRKNLQLRINFYSEQDGKNQPLLQDLTDEKKIFLSSVGDKVSEAYYSTIDSLGFDSNEIRYKRIDSLGYTIYVYSINPDSALYRLNFTSVGFQKGNYVQENSVANGRIFKWIAPVNGVPQGDYEPLVLLVAPIQNQLLTYAADYKISKNTTVQFEGAFSNQDKNLFSTKDDRNNKGFASRTIIENKNQLRSDSLVKLSWKSSLFVEFLDKNFNTIEPYRSIEFNRNYNIQANLIKTNELLIGVATGIERNGLALLEYRLNTFLKDTFYTGIQQILNSNLDYRKYKFRSQVVLLNTDESQVKTVYLKHKLDLNRSWNYFVIGVAEETERNRFHVKYFDTLSANSFAFGQYQVYIENPLDWKNKYKLDYINRTDYTPFNNGFLSSTRGEIINLNMEFNNNPNRILIWGATYRKVGVLHAGSNQKAEETMLIRTQYDWRFAKGFVSSGTYYEIGSGQEPKHEFIYVQVPVGQGVYIHVDYNNNGIKELNEFEIAKFSYEADYIRVYISSSDFVRTNTLLFSETMMISPERIWNNRTGIKKIVSLFSNQTAFKIDRKILDDVFIKRFNPFEFRDTDTSLIALNSSFRNTIYFKRTDPIFGMDYTFQRNVNKSILTSGFDTRLFNENIIRSHWNFMRFLGISSEFIKGYKSFYSQFLYSRNYYVEYFTINPEFSCQLNTAVRLAISYGYKEQKNKPIYGNERSVNNRFSSECRYNISGKGSVITRVSYIYNKYLGTPNTPIAYELLEGLQVGNNLTWNATIQQNLGANFQLNFTYDGRSSPGAKMIHSGSVQARAFF